MFVGVVLMAAPAAAEDLLVRSAALPSVDLTEELVALGKPIEVAQPKGASLFDLALDNCGPNLRYLQLISSKLGGIETLFAPTTEDRTVELPFCLSSGVAKDQKVQDGLFVVDYSKALDFALQPRLDPEATQVMAVPGLVRDQVASLEQQFRSLRLTDNALPSLVTSAELARAFLESSSQEVPKATQELWQRSFAGIVNNWAIRDANGLDQDFYIREGDTITVPGRATWQYLEVDNGLPQELIDQLVGKVKAHASETTEAAKDGPVFLESINDKDCGVGSETIFDAEAVQAQLEMNRVAWPEQQIDARSPSILALDTGFPDVRKDNGAFAAILPDANRVRMRSYGGKVANNDIRSGPRLVFNVNTASKTDTAVPPANYSGERWHGLAVALTAVGGSPFEDWRNAASFPVRVGVASILSEGQSPAIAEVAILEAFSLADAANIDVVNASFMFPFVPPGDNAMLNELGSNRILVVAAGNDGGSFSKDSWPAQLGGDPGNGRDSIVITVGMATPEGKLHPRSARSSRFVDLIAPGCRVPTYTMDDDAGDPRRQAWTGSSFSAPVVSFVAAMLRGYELTPKEVKARLFYTVDFDPELDKVAFSSGRLNIRNALAFPFDIVVGPEGTFYGKIEKLSVEACGEKQTPLGLARVSVRGDDTIVWRLPNNPAELNFERFEKCEGSHPAVSGTFKEYGTGEEVDLSANSFTDLILRQKG